MQPSDWIALGWVLVWATGCVGASFIVAGVVGSILKRRS